MEFSVIVGNIIVWWVRADSTQIGGLGSIPSTVRKIKTVDRIDFVNESVK